MCCSLPFSCSCVVVLCLIHTKRIATTWLNLNRAVDFHPPYFLSWQLFTIPILASLSTSRLAPYYTIEPVVLQCTPVLPNDIAHGNSRWLRYSTSFWRGMIKDDLKFLSLLHGIFELLINVLIERIPSGPHQARVFNCVQCSLMNLALYL